MIDEYNQNRSSSYEGGQNPLKIFHLWYVDACPRTQKTREFMYALSIQQKAGIMRCSRFHSKSSNPSNPCYLIHLKPRRRKTRTSHGNVMFHIESMIINVV